MKYLVECQTCTQTVWTLLQQYEGGFIGLCPECKQLAYNRAELPKVNGDALIRAAGQVH